MQGTSVQLTSVHEIISTFSCFSTISNPIGAFTIPLLAVFLSILGNAPRVFISFIRSGTSSQRIHILTGTLCTSWLPAKSSTITWRLVFISCSRRLLTVSTHCQLVVVPILVQLVIVKLFVLMLWVFALSLRLGLISSLTLNIILRFSLLVGQIGVTLTSPVFFGGVESTTMLRVDSALI